MTSKTKFTRGPWDIDAGFLVTRAFAGGVGMPILELGWILGTDTECKANGHLVKAAPDLYSALEALVAHADAMEAQHPDYHQLGEDGTPRRSEPLANAMAALSRARGETL